MLSQEPALVKPMVIKLMEGVKLPYHVKVKRQSPIIQMLIKKRVDE